MPVPSLADLVAKVERLKVMLDERNQVDVDAERLQRAVQRQEEVDSEKMMALLRQQEDTPMSSSRPRPTWRHGSWCGCARSRTS